MRLPFGGVTLLLVGCVWAQSDYFDGESQYQEFITTETERGLFPSIFNLATNALINATSTCGQRKTEEYCKLVEHVLLRRTSAVGAAQCDICDANAERKRHPIEFAIDGTRRWWQSPSLANGLEYEKVNITIDLRQIYQVAYVIIKMGNSPRPGSWVLEKSLDGETFIPWQYFAANDAECMRLFGVPATTGVPRYQRDDEVHCTSEYSKLTPLENGEIHTSLVNGRPGVVQPSAELQEFTRTRYVRLRLISPRTLNADLMIVNSKRHKIDKSVTMRYFYSISDISIGGQCICYGHAESCPSDPVTGQFQCECRHNTCGESCNRCCSLFNQLPWKAGTNVEPNICQACQCFNHAESCMFDEELARNQLSITPEGVYEGGGRCVECQHNTEGVNCERCRDGYYRPSGMSHYRADACRTCDCDPVGSETDICIRDDQSAGNGLLPGDCVCKPGFGGRRCERCARGYRNYPKCEPCPCNQAGSVNFDNCEQETCVCKANVEGLYCDRCRAGTIHLSTSNPLGCQSCFCFGMTEQCEQKDWGRGQISHNFGWRLSDLSGGRDVVPEIENKEVLMFNQNQNKDRGLYYWKGPEQFNGNLLSSYGGNLHYYVYYVPTDEAAKVPIADVVIEGNGIKLEYHSQMQFHPRENITMQIALREGSGWYNSQSRKPADKADMMRVLADVSLFMVRAMYNQQQLQSSIFGLTLDKAIDFVPPANEDVLHPTPVDTLMRGVEVCKCPENFAGHSCESCAAGYRRVNNQLYGGRCEKCNCEGHSDECDPWTGECLNCQHNTTGTRCELCIPGHYGNPSLGGDLGACRPCACPSLHNNHSPECALTQLVVSGSAASGEDAYVCTACDTGFEGNKCEMCADGYFGDPLAVNGTCVECECNGNIDLMAIGNCDPISGKCLKCVGHTTGEHCEICEEHHYGSALDHTCKPCGCHHVGAVNPQCGEGSGECECKENYIGQRCDRCEEGHGDIENGCPACECDSIGSMGTECDEVSGQCSCKQGVFGKRCDKCRPSYFNFTDSGCQFCHCNIYGSIEDGKCDNVTGKCECRENVDGKMCEKCADGFFNITSGNGCQSCDCDVTGSEGVQCEIHSGQCVCKPGVTGLKCDQCAPNHYGLSNEGCKECQKCPAPGQVCDSVTGECVCPPNTVGEMCEECTKDAWDYHPLEGCKKCDCSEIGSDGSTCDVRNGQCKCKNEYVGLKCDRCSHGFFNFPTCEPCACNPDGTDPLQCKDGLCLCDDSGQCPCKKNVVGEKCDSCKAGAFSLDSSSSLGCTDCFCFNRTNFCVQSNLVWQQIYAEDRQAIFQEPWDYYQKKHNVNLLKEHPARFNSYPTDATPLYWQLPRIMLGDRTSSYNGFIRFKILNNDNRRGVPGVRPDAQYFRYFPQVVLVGNNRIELEHIPVEISEEGKYKIRLHESEWRSRLTPELAVSRKLMMIALQNLQGIYIRGTYNYPARGDSISISEISLDVAVQDNTTASGMVASPAMGVEQCAECPQGYGGASCQDPADGYCRKRLRDYLNAPDDMALLGWSEPCACNGHSTTCNPETCICTNCEHNAYGDFCELCKPGYIGDARAGGSAACTKCACPLANNSFSDSCVAVDYGRGYVCNACKPGYTGQYCESCVAGYFGDPGHEGGFCEECDCHPDGSVHGACHPLTGQCECKPGVTGRDCSRCQERHAFLNGKCTSCDQGCYLPIMMELDGLEELLAVQNFSNLRPVPWKRMSRIGNNTELLNEFVNGLSTEGSDNSLINIDGKSKYAKEANQLVDEANFLLERVNKSENSISLYTGRAEEIISSAQLAYRTSFNTTQFLKHFSRHGGSSVGGAVLDSWMTEAEAHLNATVERGEYIRKRYSRAQLEAEKTSELLKKVTANKLNDTSFEIINKGLSEFAQWMEDYRSTIYESARKDTVEAERMSRVVAKRIDRYKDVYSDIEKLRGEAEDSLGTARSSVELAKGEELLNMFDDYQKIREALEVASEDAANLTETADKYAQLIDEYDESYVEPSRKHAFALEEQAEALQKSFSTTKAEAANPIRASQAYEEIVGALKNASSAAEKAEDAAADAFSHADPNLETSMMRDVTLSDERSEALSSEAAILKSEWEAEDLEGENEKLKERLSFVNEHDIDMIRRKDSVKTQWDNFDDQHARMSGLQTMAREAEERAEEAREIAEKLKDGVKEATERTEKLSNSTAKGIREEIDKIKTARSDLEDVKNGLVKVDGLSAANKNRIEEMHKKINMLKDKIGEAREKAQQIRVSLRSDERGLCRRSFVSPASPAPTNVIHIKYRPNRNVPDSVIMSTRTQNRRTVASEHIAVEIRERRVAVLWNIGGGKRKATNSHPINFIPLTDRSTWYHIDVVRTGNAVNLTVSLKESTIGEGARSRSDPVSVFVGRHESDNDAILNTVPGETLLNVGTDEGTAKEIGLSTNHFKGVIGEMKVDEVVVPLWAFAHSTSECDGASAPPTPTPRGHTFKDGFAKVLMSVPERTVAALTVVFSTYSPDGLLYFRGDPQNGDFIALHLEDGNVVFKINLGKGSFAEIRSTGEYDDGKEHTVKAIRTNQEIHLQVDSDADRKSSVIPGDNTQMNIEGEEHYVAGVPPEFPTSKFSKFGLQWKGFSGCILTVKPSQVSELDLEHAVRSYRKEPGCRLSGGSLVPTDRLIGFSRPGYLLNQGIKIDNNSTFGFTFRTKEENGTLVYMSSKVKVSKRKVRRDQGGEGYMAFYLFRGYLVLHFGKQADIRESVVTIRSNSAYNDGNTHSVFFVREGQNVRVRVDDREIGAESLSDESDIGAIHIGMYLGGFPDNAHPPTDEIPSTVPLIGCISDVYHDYQRVPIVPRLHSAQLGSCAMETNVVIIDEKFEESEPQNGLRKSSKIILEDPVPEDYHYDVNKQPTEPSLTTDSPLTSSCSGYENAVRDGDGAIRYGISKSSHSRVNWVTGYPNITSFSLEMDVRTESADGTVWVWANYKNYTRYFILQVVDGYAQLVVKGHREPRTLVVEERRIDDGQWHSIKVVKKDRNLHLIVDDLPAVSISDCPAPKVMRRRMYFGGVISAHRKFNVSLPGFDGCIRDVLVDQKSVSLDTEASRDIVPCARPSKGIYSHEAGFAVFDGLSKYSRSDSLSVEVEFRSVINNGTVIALLNNNNPEENRLTVEVKENMILITLIHQSSGLEIRDALPAIGSLCDRKWHKVSISIGKDVMTVVIDGEKSDINAPMTSEAKQLLSNLPVHIGGVSGTVASRIGASSLQGCFRNLHLSGKAAYFEKALKTNKVLLDACPFH